MQMWVYEIQRVYLDIEKGTDVMREREEKPIESYKTYMETCLV
jgi:hypothetical protein